MQPALGVGSWRQNPNLKDLEALIRQSKILHDCPLLQDLGLLLIEHPY